MLQLNGASPRILFVSLTNDVGSNRIVAEFGRRGATCGILGAPGNFAGASGFAAQTFELPNRLGAMSLQLSLRGKLESILGAWKPERIFAIDEMGSHLLRHIAVHPKTSDALRQTLVASLGSPDHYATARSRGRLMQEAVALGVRLPDFRILSDWSSATDAARALGYPFVLKREYTCGGAGVSMIHDQSQLFTAYCAATLKATAKRMVLGIAGNGASADPPLVAQAFVPGVLAMRAVACADGEVLAGVNFACERQHPPVTGASTVIRQLDHAEMEASAKAIVARLGCSGFVGFDYMCDADGKAHLIEMNARPIGSGHLGARFGHDVYGSYLARLKGEAAPAAAPTLEPGQCIALFPRELQRVTQSGEAEVDPGILHDVPWDDPRALARHRKVLQENHPEQAAAIARILDFADADQAMPEFTARAG